jgi:HD-like signal output (HDOD) protein
LHAQKRSADDYGISKARLISLAESIEIPACPRIIADMVEVQAEAFPDPRVVARLAEQDPAMTAALLKTINSPFFGLRTKMLSVQQAVTFLGMHNVINIVTALALKCASAGVQGDGVNTFWERSSTTAAVAANLSNRIVGVARDEAYIHVLFRDAAIPFVIAQRVKRGELDAGILRDSAAYLAQVQAEQRSIDHAVIGHTLAKKWLLPERTQQSVRLHHNLELFLGGLAQEQNAQWVSLQIAIGYLADHIMREHFSLPHDELWESTQLDAFLRYVAIQRSDFLAMSEEILIELKNDFI